MEDIFHQETEAFLIFQKTTMKWFNKPSFQPSGQDPKRETGLKQKQTQVVIYVPQEGKVEKFSRKKWEKTEVKQFRWQNKATGKKARYQQVQYKKNIRINRLVGATTEEKSYANKLAIIIFVLCIS